MDFVFRLTSVLPADQFHQNRASHKWSWTDEWLRLPSASLQLISGDDITVMPSWRAWRLLHCTNALDTDTALTQIRTETEDGECNYTTLAGACSLRSADWFRTSSVWQLSRQVSHQQLCSGNFVRGTNSMVSHRWGLGTNPQTDSAIELYIPLAVSNV